MEEEFIVCILSGLKQHEPTLFSPSITSTTEIRSQKYINKNPHPLQLRHRTGLCGWNSCPQNKKLYLIDHNILFFNQFIFLTKLHLIKIIIFNQFMFF